MVLVLGVAGTSCVTSPATLTVDTVVSGLHKPWDIAFTPDGTMLFTEKSGTVNAFVDGAVRQLAAPSDVVVNWEAGMMGMAVDPAFATNRRVYTCMVSNVSGTRDVRSREMARQRELHQADQPRRHLHRHSGQPLPHPDSPRRMPTAVRARRLPLGHDRRHGTGDDGAETPAHWGARCLRIDHRGEPAPGNPGGALRPEIYTYGHRNVQGIGFRPSDGKPYSVEHGPSVTTR